MMPKEIMDDIKSKRVNLPLAMFLISIMIMLPRIKYVYSFLFSYRTTFHLPLSSFFIVLFTDTIIVGYVGDHDHVFNVKIHFL